jgi:sugar phosphate permease
VMIRTRLEAMQKEMRETMVYHSPPELGNLWTRFEEMREQITQEQKIARAEKEKQDAIEAWQREQRKEVLQNRVLWLVGLGVVLLEMWGLLWAISLHRRGQWSGW